VGGGRTNAGFSGDDESGFFLATPRESEFLGFIVFGSDEELVTVKEPTFPRDLGVARYAASGGYNIGGDVDGVRISLNFVVLV
jgi:hypothetical protein